MRTWKYKSIGIHGNPSPRKDDSHAKEYLDIKTDFIFKQLFGQPSRKHITIAFLNDLLGRKEDDRIIALTFENTESVKDIEDGKTVRLDLLVSTSSGERINVEVQGLELFSSLSQFNFEM